MNQTTIDVHLSSGLKTIAQTSMEVADTLIMLAKSHPDFQKWSISVRVSGTNAENGCMHTKNSLSNLVCLAMNKWHLSIL